MARIEALSSARRWAEREEKMEEVVRSPDAIPAYPMPLIKERATDEGSSPL